MKKLVYALVLCLCASELTVLAPVPVRPALAEDKDAEADEKAKQAEEEAKKQAEAEAKKKAEEEAKKQAEEEAKRQAEEEAARKQAEEEAAKKQAEEEAKKQAEEEAKRQAEEEAKRQAEEEAKRQAEEEAKKQAEEEAQKQAEEEAKKQAEEAAEQKQAEEKPVQQEEKPADKPQTDSKDAAQKKPEKKKEKNDEKEAEKPREYAVDLAGNGQFLLSELLAAAKADFRITDIKAVEPENEDVAKLLAWEQDEKDKDDLAFTVLKDFKEARLILKTKQDSCVLVLTNGAKAVIPEAAPAQEKKQTKVENEPAPTEETVVETASEEGAPEKTAAEQTEAADAEQTGTADAEQTLAEAAQDETDAQDEDAPEEDAQNEGTPDEDEDTPDEGEDVSDEGEELPDESGDPQDEGENEEEAGSGVELPEDAEAWFKRDGALKWGTLDEVVTELQGGETVYIQAEGTLAINGAPVKVLSTVALEPDSSVFGSGCVVRVSMQDPGAVEEPELIELSQLEQLIEGDYVNLYVWVEKTDDAPGEDGDEEKPVITVTPNGHIEAAWNNTRPEFQLSGIPEGENWTYAALIYNERFVPMSDDVYIPTEQGQYTLRFVMQDELGDIKAVSEPFEVWLDWTEPEVTVEVDEESSYTLYVTATDSVSGLAAISLNGGKLWIELADGKTYTYTGKSEKTFEAGDIQARDVAGNVFVSDEDYTLEALEDEEEEADEDDEGGGGGGGGEGGSGTPALSHASGDGEEGSEYDALLLELPEDAMEQLTVGGEPMDLTLMLESAQSPEAPVGDNQPFTASLRRWNGDGTVPDTLVLDAELDANLGDAFTYEWRFNGEVYRLLANSGIKYVALKVGDDVAAFPTEGFTGGTRYTELKMQGVSTRKFDYTLSMKVNLDPDHVSATSENDFSQDCELSIRAAVEDTNYELSSSPKSIMYFYNVYLGPEAMMDQPFGEYQDIQ